MAPEPDIEDFLSPEGLQQLAETQSQIPDTTWEWVLKIRTRVE